MSDLSLLPAPRLSTDVERSLVELAEHRMLAPARRAGYELRLVGATVLPQHQTISRTQHGTWLFVDHVNDPTAEEYKGRIPVPEDQIQRLVELGRQGVRPQFAWFGHQLPASYREGDPLPQLVPAPRELREKDERLRLWIVKIMQISEEAAKAVANGIGLDPLIFGGVMHPELPTVMWCVLAQWEWE